jgi:hypothetical protein
VSQLPLQPLKSRILESRQRGQVRSISPIGKVVENPFQQRSGRQKSSPARAAIGLYGLQCLEESASLEQMHDDIDACT